MGASGSREAEKEQENPPTECRQVTCAIQECLAANGHAEEKCEAEIEAYKACMADYERRVAAARGVRRA